jgi:hypothetical protein
MTDLKGSDLNPMILCRKREKQPIDISISPDSLPAAALYSGQVLIKELMD